MNKEIKINKLAKSITFINNEIAFSQFGIADEILDLISNLQQENQQLKKQKDDVVEYIKENKDKTITPYGDNEDTDYEVCLFEEDINEILRMLGEIE